MLSFSLTLFSHIFSLGNWTVRQATTSTGPIQYAVTTIYIQVMGLSRVMKLESNWGRWHAQTIYRDRK